MATEKLTVEGLQKEQKELLTAFHGSQEVLGDAQAAFRVAKDNLVEFNNSYGRVLEVLESSE